MNAVKKKYKTQELVIYSRINLEINTKNQELDANQLRKNTKLKN